MLGGMQNSISSAKTEFHLHSTFWGRFVVCFSHSTFREIIFHFPHSRENNTKFHFGEQEWNLLNVPCFLGKFSTFHTAAKNTKFCFEHKHRICSTFHVLGQIFCIPHSGENNTKFSFGAQKWNLPNVSCSGANLPHSMFQGKQHKNPFWGAKTEFACMFWVKSFMFHCSGENNRKFHVRVQKWNLLNIPCSGENLQCSTFQGQCCPQCLSKFQGVKSERDK